MKILTPTERETHVLDSDPMRSIYADTGISQEEMTERFRRAPVDRFGNRAIEVSDPDRIAEVNAELGTDKEFAQFTPVEKKT